ncbi:hypothetical protein SERLADRAFT_439666 [Serpula lacrymans var. lacrymans S7.9]|uniref:Uncharacterized protein n=1 Tax=Serpula lacrymans var. lacrymans (strain S7.9) TaxID=578457 RepID=F8P160_SERL9|nr:uncharacterized protein SERLADRAFT_439666 [Serpula lacrymans var. lacrymans S7.9]EGO22891.1 hypothetical protein SERLADRAFT_439666 [Serpula lacrymans var. lacrymans S7.9]
MPLIRLSRLTPNVARRSSASLLLSPPLQAQMLPRITSIAVSSTFKHKRFIVHACSSVQSTAGQAGLLILSIHPSSMSDLENNILLLAVSISSADVYNVNADHQTAAPPIEIYSAVFGHFSRRVRDPDFDVSDEASRDLLAKLLNLSLDTVSNQDKTSANYMSVHSMAMGVDAAPVIEEVQGELGLGGSDPFVQKYTQLALASTCLLPIRTSLKAQMRWIT